MVVRYILSALVFFYWIVMFIIHCRGLWHFPKLQLAKKDLLQPKVSIIVAARNEEAAIQTSLRSIIKQDYENYELIVVNDRSDDTTGQQIEDFRREAINSGTAISIKVIHIKELPHGWLGKNYALFQGYLSSDGEYLLFTDADIIYSPFTLHSAIAFVKKHQADHLTAAPEMLAKNLFLKGFIHFFLFSLCMYKWPWRPNNDRQHDEGFGIGAFNLISRNVYEKVGTHMKLSMRPDDDLQLGMMVKRARFRQRFVSGADFLKVEWYPSIWAAVKGLEKNIFAGLDYSLLMVSVGVLGQIIFYLVPFIGCFSVHGLERVSYLAAVLLMIGLFLLYDKKMSQEIGMEALFMPFSIVLLIFIIIRSTYVTLKQNGIVWRGTFYSLDDLKRMKKESTYDY